MKLSKIYSNQKSFSEVIFKDGINAIIATGNKPHSVGKTTLIQIINFCLLKSQTLEIFKKEEFKDYIFYLEIKLNNGKYITIKRNAKGNEIGIAINKINLYIYSKQDFNEFSDIKKALYFLNQQIGLQINDKYLNIRDFINYFIKDTESMLSVFNGHNIRSNDYIWKSKFLDLIGFDGDILIKKHKCNEELKSIKQEKKTFEKYGFIDKKFLKNIDYEIENKQEHINTLKEELNQFNFFKLDTEYDCDLYKINEEKNSKLAERSRLIRRNKIIEKSLINKEYIDLKRVEKIYNEMKINLNDSVKKSFEEVINFNESIVKERRKYLKAELEENNKKILDIDSLLENLEIKIKQITALVYEQDLFKKYNQISENIISLEKDLNILISQKKHLSIFNDKNEKIEEEIIELIEKSRQICEMFFGSKFDLEFQKISKDLLDEICKITLSMNKQNNIDIKKSSNGSVDVKLGEAYTKIYCFILAITAVLNYRNDNFFQFVIFDGLFDSLGKEYKQRLVNFLEKLNKNDIQVIFTSIEDELEGDEFIRLCKTDYNILSLEDTEYKRLFKMNKF